MGSQGIPHLEFKDKFYNSIDGQLKTTKDTRQGINPATEAPNPEVPVATIQDVDDAVAAARSAFTSWSKWSYAERRDAIHRFADAVESYQEDFSALLYQEQGKPVSVVLVFFLASLNTCLNLLQIQFARDEIKAGVQWLRELSDLELPEEPVAVEDKGGAGGKQTIILRYLPLGVVVGIVPWNFPVHLACGKLGPALVTGNTIIIKPSPFTPYCDLKLGELAQAFFPPGVVQVLSGDDKLGPWLTAHPGVDKISFTGSTATGKAVMASAAKTLKRVTLEL